MTETEYTPTTEEVRNSVAFGAVLAALIPDEAMDIDFPEPGLRVVDKSSFDLWLAPHDREVEAAARADQIEKDAQIAAGDHRPTGYGLGALNSGSRSQWYSRGRDQAGAAIRAQLADTLEASEHGVIKLDTAQAPIDDCWTLTKRLAEAEAILAAIEKQRSRMDYSGDWPDREVLARFGNVVETILAQSPTDVLAAHDREVVAKDSEVTRLQGVIDAAPHHGFCSSLYSPKWGCSCWKVAAPQPALVSDPSRAEIMVAFRKMDALAAMGEDTPEYRAAFAEFERAVRNTAPSTPKLCWECDGHGAQITDSGGTDRERITCHVCGSTPPSTPEQAEGEKQ